MVTDGQGTPLTIQVTAGQTHESTAFETTVTAVRIKQPRGRARCRPRQLAGDKAYDVPRIRHWLRKRGIASVIP